MSSPEAEIKKVFSPIGNQYLDSRDIVERLNYLENLPKEEVQEEEEYPDEYKELFDLREEIGKKYFDFGITFIEVDYWEEYAEELAYDVGLADRNNTTFNWYIDWEKWAEALSQDYSSVNLGSYEYYYQY